MAGAFLKAWERAVTIPGWLLRDEARLLFNLASTGPWCEVGSWKGRSSVILGSVGPGHAVDMFRDNPRAEYDRNTAGLPITVHHGRMEDMADRVPAGLRLLFLDADHSLDGTRAAFDLYAPKLAPHGIVVFHDALSGGDWPNPDLDYRNPPPGPPDNPWPGVREFTDTLDWRHLTDVGTCRAYANT